MSILQAIRTFFFYLLLGTSSFLWCTLSFFIAPFLPFKARYRFINVYWCRCALWLSKVFLNIRFEIKGAENVPDQPCVILSNHQSTWETFFLSAYFSPLSQVLKRELLYVPFFGWAMAMLRPIAIDRDNPKAALKHVAKKGDELLKDGVWVLIFPEGTRVPTARWASSHAVVPPWRSTPTCLCCQLRITPASSGPRLAGPNAQALSPW